MKKPKMEDRSNPLFPDVTTIFLLVLLVLIYVLNTSTFSGASTLLKGCFVLLIFVFLRFWVYFLKKSEYIDAKRKYQDEVAEYEAYEKYVADLQSEIKRLDNK